MKVTFLGTGTSQGVPVIACKCPVCQSLDYRDKRFRASIAVEVEGKHLVVDTGPDFRAQSLANRLTHLDAVLITHSHKDHVAGLDDTRPFYFRREKKDIPVYGSEASIECLKREFHYGFAEHKYPGAPGFEPHIVGGEDFEIEGIRIIPIHVLHHKMPVMGFRIGDFSYVTDANHISPIERDKIRGSKVFVLNALQKTKHLSHFSLEEAIAVAQDIKAEVTYFTHFGHYMGRHQEVSKELPDQIRMAYDGLVLEV